MAVGSMMEMGASLPKWDLGETQMDQIVAVVGNGITVPNGTVYAGIHYDGVF